MVRIAVVREALAEVIQVVQAEIKVVTQVGIKEEAVRVTLERSR